MSDTEDDFPCRFRWDISGLFFPLREFEATFYSEFPTLMQWKATFEPLTRQFNSRQFSFSVCNVTYGERPLGERVIIADEILILISVGEHVVQRRRRYNYFFSSRNRYAFEFSFTLLFPPFEGTHLVSIDVQLSLLDQNVVNQQNELVSRECDLLQLSEDLADLLDDPRYFNLRLMSSRPINRIYPVHSCIIRTRWSNFFSVHPVQTIIDGTVVVNISNVILDEILRYMYADILDTEAILEDMSLRTELFQVVDLYRIHHLYKVFAADSTRQMRYTTTDSRSHESAFQLDDLPLDGHSFSLTANPNSDHEITFQIRFFLDDVVPWFHYTFSSGHNLLVHVRLVIQMWGEAGDERSYTVHVRDYTIDSDTHVGSGICHFEGNFAGVADFINGILHGGPNGGTEHFIHCSIYASDGTTVLMIRGEGDTELRDDTERLKVLSDHMYEMLIGSIEADFILLCPIDRPEDPYLPNAYSYLHKSIFAVRIPNWRAVLENVPEEDVVPDLATCTMSSEAFGLFIAYVYSGKLFPIPNRYFNEIENFAIRGGLRHLRTFLYGRRVAIREL